MNLAIQKNVALPPRKPGPGRPPGLKDGCGHKEKPVERLKRWIRPRSPKGIRYPWNSMEVGDSFFIAGTLHAQKACREAASQRGLRYEEKYAARKVSESGVEGLRVWRVE